MVVGAAGLVTWHEAKVPYREQWRPDRREVGADLLFMLTVQIALPYLLSLAATIWLADWLRSSGLAVDGVWPHGLPAAMQVVMMLLAADFARYWLHRAFHRYDFMWSYHAVHHSPHRLYWLNVGRFHQAEGFRDFKVKVSGRSRRDRRKMRTLGDAGAGDGRGIRVRIDANNLWNSADECASHITSLGRDIFAVEEPLTADDLDGFPAGRRRERDSHRARREPAEMRAARRHGRRPAPLDRQHQGLQDGRRDPGSGAGCRLPAQSSLSPGSCGPPCAVAVVRTSSPR